MYKARFYLQDETDGTDGGESGGSGHQAPDAAEALAAMQAQMNTMAEQMQSLAAENNRLQGALSVVQAQPTPAPAAEPKTYTRSQLRAAVEAGQITEDEMDEIWVNQTTRQITKQVTQEVSGVLTQKQLDTQVDAELDEYKRLIPNSMVNGTDERRALEAEYNRLRSMGYPRGNTTEVIASRITFGTLDKLRLAQGKRPTPESHQDGGGAGADDGKGEGGGKGGDPVKGMDARTRSHYARLIDNGVYKNWDAVRDELKFAKKRA